MNNIRESNELQFIKRKSPYLLQEAPQKLVKISTMSQIQFKEFLESLSLNFTQLTQNLQQMLTLYNVQIFLENENDQLLTNSDDDSFTKSQQRLVDQNYLQTWSQSSISGLKFHKSQTNLSKRSKPIGLVCKITGPTNKTTGLIQFRNQQLNWLEIALRLDKNKTKFLSKAPFTIQDDILLLQKAIQLNFDWKKIQKIIQPKRSQADLISRFIKLQSEYNNIDNLIQRVQFAIAQLPKYDKNSMRILPQQSSIIEKSMVEYETLSILDLNLFDAMSLQFCLVKHNQIYFVTLEYMQQLVNLKLNQRKLLQFIK
ncbi:unnamed protein product (macronuclear) [Paramecium tetraurelia]|uniref:SANT domain-containing protein n=1 Tax=Paramecium tetraurelia TaxID=5888 RepID=A0D1R9_PARTE|nr:uncharacterized protein GSPATT00012510001 [Paramecium tetraurelia]CAK76986.1 unnamed protein product [Paramecium tetraurelia]|eukprot:XP_001444383.1 hypothetical protein (macronuclear) [Paramecium tetraurelia strain d4-2]